MKAKLNGFLILLLVLFAEAEFQKLCGNGVFKCVSPTSLRICFLDKLATSEFFCPNTTFCNENSPTICTTIPSALRVIEYNENSATTNSEVYPDLQCSEQGVFEIENTGCTTFLNCSSLGEVQELTCDEVSLFNPETKSCDEDYICSETLDYIQSYDDCSEADNSFVCTKVGNFPLPNTNCTKYIYCKRIYIGFKAIQKYCPTNTSFDPIFGKCIMGHICKDECSTTTVPITTTTFIDFTTMENTTPDDSLKCPGVGKFPVTNTNCTVFRLCVNSSNGIVYKDYTCPLGSYYNPSAMKCSTSYVCSPLISTTSSTNPPDTPTPSPPDTPTPNPSDTTTPSPPDTPTPSPPDTPTPNPPDTPTPNPPDTSKPNPPDSPTPNPPDTPTPSSPDTPTLSPPDNSTPNLPDTPTPSSPDTSTPSPPDTPTPNQPETSTPNSPDTSTPNPPYTSTSNPPGTPTPNPPETPIPNPPDTPTPNEPNTSTPNEPDTPTPNPPYTSTPNPPDTQTPNPTDTPTLNPTDETTPNPPIIDCRSQGRLPALNTKCKMYYQCTLTTNGYKYMIYECSEGTFFDPYKKICLDSYTCPETITTSTTTMDEITSTSTEASSPIVPSCTEQGKFPISNTKCKSYISCILTTSGFISSEYVCSENLLFDPNLKKCSSNYICEEETSYPPKTQEIESIETTPPIKPDFGKCTQNGKFPVPNSKCSQFIICSSTANGFKFQIYTCPINSFYDPENKWCSQTYSCSELDTTPPTDLDIPECYKSGKFTIHNTGCSKYILCSYTSTGFKSKIYTCPIDSFFNPEMKRCQKEYVCPELPTDLETTTEILNSEECVDVLKESTVCTKAGKFPVIGRNCKQYVLCTQTSLGFRSKIYNCLNDSNFDPNKSKCTVSYSCTEKVCSIDQNKNKTVKLIKKPIISKCTSPGKFSIKGTNCKTFKLCVWTDFGYTQTVYDCPEGTYFNQRLQSCSENYICTEDKLYNCTTIGRFKDSSDTTCQSYISCKANSKGIVRGEQKLCPEDYYFDPVIQKCSAYYICKGKKLARAIEKTPKFLVNGQCTTVGRYAVPATNCKNYMYCADNGGGTLKGTLFKCPTTTVFNQAIQKCAATYICPDSVCQFPGLLAANPNSKDCTSYIQCEDIFDPITGLIVGSTGRVVFCPVGQKFDPIMQCCSSTYVCRL